MLEELQQLAPSVKPIHIFTLLVLKYAFDFGKFTFVKANGKNKTDGIRSMVEEMSEQVAWLKEAHNVKDADGVFAWYVKSSFKDEVSRLAEAIKSLNLTIHEVHIVQKQQTRVLEALVDKIKG